MISLSQHPPGRATSLGGYDPFFAVRVRIPPALNVYYGAANRFGTRLLSELIEAKLAAGGIRVRSASYILPLDRAMLLFRLQAFEQMGTALKVGTAELARIELLQWCQIAWQDTREGIWRMHRPKVGIFDMATDLEQERERAFLSRCQARADAKVQELIRFAQNNQPGGAEK